MADRHPSASTASPLVMGQIEKMPILETVKTFFAMNESVVCTVETRDRDRNVRGAIALGLSRHDLPHGFVVYQTIIEAEAIVALLQNGIADARRIEAGITPLAPVSDLPPAKH